MQVAWPPENRRGRRECRVLASPMARLQTKKAGGSDHRSSRISRHSLRNGVTAYTRPPRCPGLIATVALRSSPQGLIPASGDQDHATSPSASATLVRRAIRVPAPRFVTIGRNVPLHRGGMRETLLVICRTAQARVSATDWHDGQIVHGVYALSWRSVPESRDSQCSLACLERADSVAKVVLPKVSKILRAAGAVLV
jgi:hypothetical protein